jgi:hypothetical protein
MGKVTAEMILKPRAVLEVKKIDFNDPEIKALVAETRRQQKAILRYKIVTRKALEAVVNI